MAIVVNPNPGLPFSVTGRVGFNRNDAKYVDATTVRLQNNPLTRNALGPVERAYNPAIPHQNINGPGGLIPGQGTMRAHHIADSQIQRAVCDYMNSQMTLTNLLDKLGVLYLTSWIDVVIPLRLLYIWQQWAGSLWRTFGVALARLRSLPPVQQAQLGTELAEALSSSISNLRVGDQPTDAALGKAIAPRLQRGQWDLIGAFVAWLSGHNFAQPTLSVETSLAVAVWGDHFRRNPLALGGQFVAVNNVFAGTLANGQILISEERPVPPAQQATIATPQTYPGTQGYSGYIIIRATRATMHLGVILGLLFASGFLTWGVAGLLIGGQTHDEL